MPIYESPFEDYPGRVTLPDKFTPEHYRLWAEANADRDGDPTDGVSRLASQWRTVIAIGEVEIDGLPDSLAFDDLPEVKIAVWAAEVIGLYLAPFLVRPRLLARRGDTVTGAG